MTVPSAAGLQCVYYCLQLNYTNINSTPYFKGRKDQNYAMKYTKELDNFLPQILYIQVHESTNELHSLMQVL